MKRTPHVNWKRPVTYSDFVAEERATFERRIKQLAVAHKMIVALEPDFALLRAKNIAFDLHPEYGLIVDCRTDMLVGRAVNGIRLDTGIFSETCDRAVHALVEMGYVFEREWRHGHPAGVILRRPKTQKRLAVRCSPECLAALKSPEVA